MASEHATSAGKASVAVMPFEVVGAPDSTSLHFRDGLAEEIGRHLSALNALRVAPRVATERLGGLSVRDIGKNLGVELVLEGTLQLGADRIRVTANLVDAAHEHSVMPALRIECRFAHLLSAQDDVAREICEGLAPSLTGTRSVGC